MEAVLKELKWYTRYNHINKYSHYFNLDDFSGDYQSFKELVYSNDSGDIWTIQTQPSEFLQHPKEYKYNKSYGFTDKKINIKLFCYAKLLRKIAHCGKKEICQFLSDNYVIYDKTWDINYLQKLLMEIN